jgi:NitT/TauT family transport system permease protein
MKGNWVMVDRAKAAKKTGKRRPNKTSRLVLFAYPLAAVAIAVLIWAIGVKLFKVPPYLLPSPQAVLVSLIDKFGLIISHLPPTAIATISGLGLSIVLGVPFAMMLVASQTLERAFMPLLVGSQCFPKVAIGPILIVWFGWGILPKVLISFIIAFFPIVIQTVLGLKSVERDEIDLIRIMSPSRLQVFTKIRIPNALPYFFGGLKVSVTLALIGAIVGEFIGSDRGLGYLLQYANVELDTELLFATMIILLALGGSLFVTVIYAEKKLLPWHVAVRGEQEGAQAPMETA